MKTVNAPSPLNQQCRLRKLTLSEIKALECKNRHRKTFTGTTFVKKKKGNILNVHQKELTQIVKYYAFFKNGLDLCVLTQSNVHDTLLSEKEKKQDHMCSMLSFTHTRARAHTHTEFIIFKVLRTYVLFLNTFFAHLPWAGSGLLGQAHRTGHWGVEMDLA